MIKNAVTDSKSPYHKAKRNSSVEIFRIIAAVLVLVVHFNGWMVGNLPDSFDFQNVTPHRVGQLIIQAFACVCVNCFLVISGYYGIKLRFSSVFNLFILLVGIKVPMYLIECTYAHPFSLVGFAYQFLAFTTSNYFVQCYLMLMFLSPMINAFVEKQQKSILYYAIAFVFIEFWAECIRHQQFFGFDRGFNIMHFVLMYVLARTAWVYRDVIMRVKPLYWVMGYVVCSSLVCVMYLIGIKFSMSYTNPVVIASSFCLFFPFLHKHFYSRWVNWIASSSLAVYILHTHGTIFTSLCDFDQRMLNECSYATYLMIMGGTIIVVFIASVLYDKMRAGLTSIGVAHARRLWTKLSDRVQPKQ